MPQELYPISLRGLVVFFLLHCFKNSQRLASDNPVVELGSLVALGSSFCRAKREKLQGVVCKESA